MSSPTDQYSGAPLNFVGLRVQACWREKEARTTTASQQRHIVKSEELA